jgi:twitching motility protein PilT
LILVLEKETELKQTLIGNITVSNPQVVSKQQSENFAQVSLADQKKSSSPTKIKSESEDSSMNEGSLPNTFVGNRGEGSLGFEPITDYALTSSLDQLLHLCRFDDASDLHLSTGSPIVIRKYGSLRSFGEILTNVHIEKFIAYLSPLDQKQLKDNGDHELIYTISGSGRCRMTLMKHRAGYDITSRIIANSIRPFNESGLPDHCKSLTKWAQGLVLLTGPVGCGKTTTLSTLVDLVNQERKDHIISIESPVEIVYPNGNCQMTQREVGTHTMSQASALKGALRQDPDILVVSELRDLESIELAVSAAETGHLVFATMNTTNAMRTISRLIDSFPIEKRDIVRAMVSESLRGVISQQLIPKKSGDGVVVAYEVLMVTAPVTNLIRKDELHQLESAMMTGKSQGMILLDDSLQQLVDSKKIAGDEAFYRANNSKRFESYVS